MSDSKDMSEQLRDKILSFCATTAVTTFLSVGASWLILAPSQDRQAKLESTIEFALSTNGVVGLSSDLLASLAAGASPSEAKSALRRELGVQVNSAQNIASLFGSKVKTAADNYVAEIEEFSSSIGEVDVNNIGEWAVAIDQVVIAHSELQRAMLGEIGGQS